MKVKAIKGFSGAVSMRKGEVREICDKHILADLMNAGYVVEETEEVKEKPKKKAKKTGGDVK